LNGACTCGVDLRCPEHSGQGSSSASLSVGLLFGLGEFAGTPLSGIDCARQRIEHDTWA
jgi:hypothetical protein